MIGWRGKVKALRGFDAPNLRNEGRDRGKEVLDEPVVGDLENGRLGVLVDRHDDLRALHAGQVLDRTRDADRDVELRSDDFARLADLEIARGVAGVARGAAGADRGVERVGQRVEDLLEALFQRATAGHDDGSLGELGALALHLIERDERDTLGARAGWRERDRFDRRASSRRRSGCELALPDAHDLHWRRDLAP